MAKFMSKDLKYKHLYIVLIFYFAVLLSAFNVYAGDLTLEWDAPTTNTDGTTLTDVAGYTLYYSTISGSYDHKIDVGNVTTYKITNLVEGINYYFVVTALDTSGNESESSNQLITTADSPPVPEPEITIYDSVAPIDDLHVAFGDLTEFNTSDQTITMKNDGTSELLIGNIIQSDQSSTPFSRLNDNCSLQHMEPSGKCSFTVRFSPESAGQFSDVINIPSNDSNESMVSITLNGTGLSSAVNNPPSKPQPKSPKNRGKGYGRKVDFKWKKSSDPDGDTVSYQLNICEDPELTTGCITESNILADKGQDMYYAGIGSFSMGLLLFGIVIILPFNRETGRKFHVFVAAVAVTGMLFLVSCGGGGNNSLTSSNSQSLQEEVSQEVSEFHSSTTYYWQIVADDGKGGKTYSDIWSFETK
jgi:hypothetical protein